MSWNIAHMMQIYSSSDLCLLSAEVGRIAEELRSIANEDLERTSGTTSRWLNDIASQLGELACSAKCAELAKSGESAFLVYDTEGRFVGILPA